MAEGMVFLQLSKWSALFVCICHIYGLSLLRGFSFNEDTSMSDYKKTLNLPGTSFPMKANLTQREPEMLRWWEENGA